jgi:hypothetical protein
MMNRLQLKQKPRLLKSQLQHLKQLQLKIKTQK